MNMKSSDSALQIIQQLSEYRDLNAAELAAVAHQLLVLAIAKRPFIVRQDGVLIPSRDKGDWRNDEIGTAALDALTVILKSHSTNPQAVYVSAHLLASTPEHESLEDLRASLRDFLPDALERLSDREVSDKHIFCDIANALTQTITVCDLIIETYALHALKKFLTCDKHTGVSQNLRAKFAGAIIEFFSQSDIEGSTPEREAIVLTCRKLIARARNSARLPDYSEDESVENSVVLTTTTSEKRGINSQTAGDRGQHGLAAALRFLLLPVEFLKGGWSTERLSRALQFELNSDSTAVNTQPFDRPEFLTVLKIIQRVSQFPGMDQGEIASLLGYLALHAPTDESVTEDDRARVMYAATSQADALGIISLNDSTEELAARLGLECYGNVKTIYANTPANADRDTPEMAMARVMGEQTPADEDLIKTGKVTGLSREAFLQFANRLLALAPTREPAAFALTEIVCSSHEYDVTEELRLDIISRLFRSTGRSQIQALALDTQEKIAILKFNKREDIPEAEAV